MLSPKRHAPLAQAVVAAAIIALAIAAAGRGLVANARSSTTRIQRTDATAWPYTFEGRVLASTSLLPVEKRFGESFPGAFAAFTDGTRRIVFRRIDAPTRMMHPAEGCLRGAGFSVQPLPARRYEASGLWAALAAEKDGERLFVREHISDDAGHTWTDVSAWYWSALMRPSSGPWLATTVIEPVALTPSPSPPGSDPSP